MEEEYEVLSRSKRDRLWNAYLQSPHGSERAYRLLLKYRNQGKSDHGEDLQVETVERVGKKWVSKEHVLTDFANGLNRKSVAARNDITEQRAGQIRQQHYQACRKRMDVTLRVDLQSLDGVTAQQGTEWRIMSVKHINRGLRNDCLLQLRSGKRVLKDVLAECVVLPEEE